MGFAKRRDFLGNGLHPHALKGNVSLDRLVPA